MSLTADLIARIEAEVGALAGRTRGAADLSELVATKQWPQSPAAAFVLPLGLRARDEGEAATGYFLQMLDEAFAIVLVVRAQGDATGARAVPRIDELVAALVAAIAGWGPDDAGSGPEAVGGVFRVSAGNLLSAEGGMVLYQLDFVIQTQVRNLG